MRGGGCECEGGVRGGGDVRGECEGGMGCEGGCLPLCTDSPGHHRHKGQRQILCKREGGREGRGREG